MKTALFCGLLLLSTASVMAAQWAKQRDTRVPLRDGKPNPSAPTPKASDGQAEIPLHGKREEAHRVIGR